jgi:hypothetical protein
VSTVATMSEGVSRIALHMEAISRLLKIASGDTGQSGRAANFLLAWWNASRDGGFDLTDLWNVDQAIADDMVTVFNFVANFRVSPDSLGLGPEFEQLVTLWRQPKKRRAAR